MSNPIKIHNPDFQNYFRKSVKNEAKRAKMRTKKKKSPSTANTREDFTIKQETTIYDALLDGLIGAGIAALLNFEVVDAEIEKRISSKNKIVTKLILFIILFTFLKMYVVVKN